MDFLRKVNEVISSAQEKKEAQEKEMEELKNLLAILCQKAKEAGVSLAVTVPEGAVRINSTGLITLAREKDPNGMWRWQNITLSEEEAVKSWLYNQRGLFYHVLSSALKNEAEVEICK